MYRFLLTALAVGVVVQPSSFATKFFAAEVRAADPQANSLEGAWTLVSTEQDGKVRSELADPFMLVVSGTTVRLRHGEQLIWEATLRQQAADEAGRVKFDLTYDRTQGIAPPPEDDGSGYGLFQVRGDELKFATAHGTDDRDRPKDFDTTGGSGDGRVFTWHRAEKATTPRPAVGIKR